MEIFPPSYEHATARDTWAIVARYIPSSDLCAACLVSRKWHELFVPSLWGAPALHFRGDSADVYDALTRFRKILRYSRCWVRELTHTLHLPPAPSEIYYGPERVWLLEVLEYLPKLQSLIVSRLSFFDHDSLLTLDAKSGQSRLDAELRLRTYDLRLLLADREPNTTSVALRRGLLHFPKLVYLDLSYTTSAKDYGVLSALSHLFHLQVLKLRGIGLRDPDADVLARAIGIRVRLLDLRNNLLSDSAIRALMHNCFPPSNHSNDYTFRRMEECQFEWRPPTVPLGSILTSDSMKDEHLDGHFLKQLTMPLDGRSTLEDIPHVGITHLYVADNNISVDGLLGIVGLGMLLVLDCGTIGAARLMKESMSLPASRNKDDSQAEMIPGAERLVPILCQPAGKSLTYLRIHHAMVTSSTQVLKGVGPWTASAPEEEIARDCLIQDLIARRPTIPATDNQSSEGGHLPFLHPSNLSHLKTLILTDLPSSVPSSSPILSSLKRFITACGDESLLASLRAQSDYSLPPGRYRAKAEKQHAKSLFALERLILEIRPVSKPSNSSSWSPSGYHNPNSTKSSTGDADSENLWTAAMNDFSFFSEDVSCTPANSQRCGVGSVFGQDPGKHEMDLIAAIASFRREKRIKYDDLRSAQQRKGGNNEESGGISSSTQSTTPIYVEGHWNGEIRVVK
uniref:Leucine Rich Repeat domain-containing protein n=1 Tax=Coccidioides posadasii RMSCC 3488 TaxID=454284 RepID=A0A0J6FSJ8_COCPO|nr:hypothetical protein CPAG_09632 [Coccidioides posadasii RMSCC 3488]